MQNFRALGAPPPDPVPPAAGGIAPDANTAPHCEFLATRLGSIVPCPTTLGNGTKQKVQNTR